MNIVIIDYGSGNLRSVAKSFERAARAIDCDSKVLVTSDADAVADADRIILPGVGAFADCLDGLKSVTGMEEALQESVIDKGRPFLGICVGMQLMATLGREHMDTMGLNWLSAEVVPIKSKDIHIKVPHMGWNNLVISKPAHPILSNLPPDAHGYFVHSYAMRCHAPEDVIAEVDYSGRITAAVGRDNMVGTQFHPEKSQATGLKLIQNFIMWSP